MYLNGSLLGAPATYRSFNGYTGPWSLGSWSGTSQFGNYALNNGRFYNSDGQGVYGMGEFWEVICIKTVKQLLVFIALQPPSA